MQTINKEYPETAKRLLSGLKAGSLDISEFNKEVAYWAKSNITELRCRPMPTPPDDVIVYARKKIQDNTYKLADDFWRRKDIYVWFEQISKWRAENKSDYDWLVFIKENLVTDEEKQAVDDQLRPFEESDFFLHGRDFLMAISNYAVQKLPNREGVFCESGIA